MGYHVIDFSRVNTSFHYPSIFHRIYNLYRKVIFSDRSYKEKLRQSYRIRCLEKSLEKVGKADFSFIIRPDLFPIDFIKNLRTKSDLTIAYQWDGIERYPKIIDYIPFFDLFLTFEEGNKSSNIVSASNFYLEEIIKNQNYTVNDEAYFLATFQPDRTQETLEIKQMLDNIGFENKFIIFCKGEKNTKPLKENNISIINKPLNYYENITNVLGAKVLVDIHNPIHNGLSFRVFEAIGYNKKLITTNKNIKNHDLYDPRNILIWDGQSKTEIAAFCNTPYFKINTKIKEKYSFKNWIETYLNYPY